MCVFTLGERKREKRREIWVKEWMGGSRVVN